MQILTQEERLLRADPLAVATARELAALIPNETVILFGSRARGDHRPDSDIDTFLLDHQATAQSRVNELHETAQELADRIYDGMTVPHAQVLPMKPAKYQRQKRSRNYLPARAATDGIIAAPDPAKWEKPDGDESQEPRFALRAAADAYKSTTLTGHLQRYCREDWKDIVREGARAMTNAHHALASAAGLTILRTDSHHDLARRIRASGLSTP